MGLRELPAISDVIRCRQTDWTDLSTAFSAPLVLPAILLESLTVLAPGTNMVRGFVRRRKTEEVGGRQDVVHAG